MEWSDLELILAVAEQDGLIGAGRALGVHPTTVSRRLKQIDADRKVRLFERVNRGVVLTAAGEDVVATARSMRSLAHDLSARLEGRDTTMAGTIRLTAVDTLLEHWMADFAAFQHKYPEVQLELVSGLDMASLTMRDADVAVRIASTVPDHLIGSRACDVAHAIYANPDLLSAYPPHASLGDLPWVSYDLSVFRGVDAFLAHRFPGARVAMRVGRIDLMMCAIERGVGIGILQCIAGDANEHLVRVQAEAGTSHLWVLTHPQLRGNARIATFMSSLRGLAARDRDLFEGRRPRTSR